MPSRRLMLLRAAAGPRDGLGHLMRSVAIAEGLAQRGVGSIVLTSDSTMSDAALDGVRRGVRIERVPAGGGQDDIDASREWVRRTGASVVVTDVVTQRALADVDALDRYHHEVRQDVDFLAVFDAGDHIDASADLVISPYVSTRDVASTNDPRVWRGPQYFIFRPEFVRAARCPRRIAPFARKVMVSVGGSDPAGLTIRIVQALVEAGGEGFDVRVVVGPGVPADMRAGIEAQVARAGHGWRVEGPPPDMAALLMWSDLAITGDGLTKYETAVTGTPSVIVARPDSDTQINRAFASARTTVCVEPGAAGDHAELPSVIRRLAADPARREAMSRRGRALTDGRGLERLIDRLLMVNAA